MLLFCGRDAALEGGLVAFDCIPLEVGLVAFDCILGAGVGCCCFEFRETGRCERSQVGAREASNNQAADSSSSCDVSSGVLGWGILRDAELFALFAGREAGVRKSWAACQPPFFFTTETSQLALLFVFMTRWAAFASNSHVPDSRSSSEVQSTLWIFWPARTVDEEELPDKGTIAQGAGKRVGREV
jgi:hypothetical protein